MNLNGATIQEYNGKKHWQKPIEVFYEGVSEHGKSTFQIRCPFCGDLVTVYTWSYHGCGKKCPECKALLAGNNARLPIKKDK